MNHNTSSEGAHTLAPRRGKPHDVVQITREMRRKWLWTNGLMIMLGLWLATGPLVSDYRSAAMAASDVISGALLALFAAAALSARLDFYGRWGAGLVGVWLLFAPLVFWAPVAATFVNDTLVGSLAITFSVLAPMMPGAEHHLVMEKPGPDIPPGWSYNPSSWHQRVPMIAAAFIAALVARYLAAFQLGYIDVVVDPVFGEGTRRVLTSDVSRSFPISDAGLGGVAYMLEMLMAWMGGTNRWRNMPWMASFFFILVVPLGIVSIVLVILQPVAVRYWCSPCLLTAFLMLVMIPFAVDEVIAVAQFLRRQVRAGKSFWHAFWIGGTEDAVGPDNRTPAYGAPLKPTLAASAWGVSVPWTLAACAALGIWLMSAPAVFGTTGGAAKAQHLVGALGVTVSVIATGEVIRSARLLNVLLGAGVAAAAWLLEGAALAARINALACGVLLAALSIPRGRIFERYGTWSKLIV